MIKLSVIEAGIFSHSFFKAAKRELVEVFVLFPTRFFKIATSSRWGLNREIGTATLRHEYFLLQTALLAALKNVWDHYPAETPNAKAVLPQRMAALLTPKYPYIENGPLFLRFDV